MPWAESYLRRRARATRTRITPRRRAAAAAPLPRGLVPAESPREAHRLPATCARAAADAKSSVGALTAATVVTRFDAQRLGVVRRVTHSGNAEGLQEGISGTSAESPPTNG